MPHLIIEYAANAPLQAQPLLRALNQALTNSGHFKEHDIKSRLHRTEDFLVGTADTPRSYVHAVLKLMPGRSSTIKQELAQLIIQTIQSQLSLNSDLGMQVSAEIIDFETPFYAKILSNMGKA